MRSNVVGYIALFFAITGSAYALGGKNSVDSGDIKRGNVKRSDIAANAVVSSKVAANTLTGADIEESSLDLAAPNLPSSLPPNGQAGGDLAGNYPNPQVAGNAIGSAEVAPDSLSVADVDESSFGFAAGPGVTMDFGRAQLGIADGDPASTPIATVPGALTVLGLREGNDAPSTECGAGVHNQSGDDYQFFRYLMSTAQANTVQTVAVPVLNDDGIDSVGPGTPSGIAAQGYARWMLGEPGQSGAPGAQVATVEVIWGPAGGGVCHYQAMVTVGSG